MTQYHKTAHTVFPNELDQISVPRASIAPTTFHDPHCNSQIQTEIGQILRHTFLSQKGGHGH